MWTVLLVGKFKLCTVEQITQLWNRLFLADSEIGGEACPGTGFHSEQRKGGVTQSLQWTYANNTGAQSPQMKCESFRLFSVHTGSNLHLGGPDGAPNALQGKELKQKTCVNMFSKY